MSQAVPAMQAASSVDFAAVVRSLDDIKSLLAKQQGSGLITATVGLAGVVGGALVTMLGQHLNARFTSKQDRRKQLSQLRHDRAKARFELTADIVSRQRQQWMDSIRDAASQLIADLDLARHLILAPGGMTEEQIAARYAELFMSAQTRTLLVLLKLNPGKPTQREVSDALMALHDFVSAQALGVAIANQNAAYAAARLRLVTALQALFGETWQRIKALER